MFSSASHWGYLGSLKDNNDMKTKLTLSTNSWAHVFVCKSHSPNPMPSYCARSRSIVCLMTASLAPWRRPCRPLIPFISSICSSSESNLWRYLHKKKTFVAIMHEINQLCKFFWFDKDNNHRTKTPLTFQWFHRRLFWRNSSFLDPTGPGTTAAFPLKVEMHKKRKRPKLIYFCKFLEKKEKMGLPITFRRVALSFFCLRNNEKHILKSKKGLQNITVIKNNILAKKLCVHRMK